LARVYLVDDHVIVREAMCALLQANGHLVVGQADEPTTALAEVLALRPEVLLVDLKLGLRSGFELLSDLHRRAGHFKTIVTTMSDSPRDVAEAVKYGADGYLLKGSTGAELMHAIDAVLKGQRHFEGKVADLAVEGMTTRDDGSALATLSARERQVIVLVVNGQSSVEIGAALQISPKTVDSYRSRLMPRRGGRGVRGLVRSALRAALTTADDL
jgi:two-component system, NarL family, invasion response regulator UvrY